MRTLLIASLSLLAACSAVKSPVEHQYQLTSFSSMRLAKAPNQSTLLVTPTEAVNGYQTEEMIYSTRQYALSNFTKNSWFSPPASMLYPLLIQSLQHSGYFYAVSSGAYISKTDYRLDSQLIEIKQNFIKKPSELDLKIKAVITRVADNQILSSHTFSQHVVCPHESPYGGVIAANQATQKLTRDIAHFVIRNVSRAKTR